MLQAFNSDNELVTASKANLGDRGSVWKPTKAAKVPLPPLVQRLQRGAQKKKGSQAQLLVSKVIVGIHALINVHEYHCIAIRMRCWLVDVFFLYSLLQCRQYICASRIDHVRRMTTNR